MTEAARSVLEWLPGLGPAGYVLFVLLYILASLLMLPATVLTLGAGAMYGAAIGIPLVSLSATLGATASFLAGRTVARGWIERKMQSMPRLAALDRGVAREGWKIVLLTRLSPAFPYVVLNYAYSLTKIPLLDYFWTTWVGMLPAIALYVSLGAAAGTAVSGRQRTPQEWAVLTAGILATLAVTVKITRLAKAALSEKL